MSEYSVEISGKYYKVDSQAILNEINSASSTSEKQEIISSYVASNKATQIDEDEYQEMQIDDEDKTEETEGTEEEYPDGFDYDSYKAYASSTGLSKLTEDSSLDDLIAIFEKIEDEINELDKKMASIDEDDPDEIATLLADMTNMTIAIGELGKAAGVEFEKNSVVDKAIASGVAGAVAVGVPAYCIATSAAAISVAVAEGAGVVAATSAAVPGPGWVVAGIGAAVAIVAGIWAYTSSKQNEEMEKKLAELQENITNAADKLNGSWDKATEKLQEGGGEAVDKVEKDLEGLLGDEFDFKDVTDVSSITENIDKIIEAQSLLEPFYNVASTYGIEIEGLDELMEKLGTGDDCLTYAQSYLDSYAEQVELNITDEVITDTETLNTLFEDISVLIKDADSKGLDTSKLEDLLEKIQKTNQEEADDEADATLQQYGVSGSGSGSGGGSSSGSGITDTVQGLINGSSQAYTTGTEVDKNSTQYETNTDSLNEASETLKSEAQKQLESYVASITLSGLSVTELEELYAEVSANYEQLKQIEGLDCKLLEAKLKEIRQTQQVLVNEEIKKFEQRINSATTTEERLQILNEINIMISDYSSIEVSISGTAALIEEIKKREEIEINTKVQNYLTQSSNATSSSEIAGIVNKIQIDIQNSQSIGCDVSGYQEALTIINKKLDEILKKESDELIQNNTTNVDMNQDNSISNSNNYEDNSTTNVDMNQDNSTTITDNSTNTINQDNSTTINNNSTNIGNIDNSTNIGNIDNSTNVNVDADTSKIEDLLQQILDKLNKPEQIPEEKDPCEPEDEVMPDDNPNKDPIVDGGENIEEEIASETVPDENVIETAPEEKVPDEPVEEETETVPDKDIVEAIPEEKVPDEPVEEETAPETIPEEPENIEEDVPCEDEDVVNIDNSDSFIETEETVSEETVSEETVSEETVPEETVSEEIIPEETTAEGPRTTAEINAGIEAQEPEETNEDSSNKTIIEGEDGYDYELDFEEDK